MLRKDLSEAREGAWAAIARPGTWLTGERRVAVAAEIRHALACAFCARLKEALSPDIAGTHDGLGKLSAPEIELVHRLVNDPGRLSESWAQSVLAKGLGEGEYVEIVGIVAMVMILDTFNRALGLPLQPLPAPVAGEPSRYRPSGAKKQAAWLPLVEPQDATEADGPMYPSPRAGYIYRGLSLVPQSLRDYWSLANAHYLPGQVVYQFDKTIRAISRPQIEVLASRVSALHQCAY
jgi:hypothetical protein